MKKLIFALSALALIGCTPAAVTNNSAETGQVNVNSNVAVNANTNTQPTPTPSATASPVPGSAETILYTNKAVGYSLMVPKNWYWQHAIVGQHAMFKADDVFVADSRSLAAVPSSEAPGRFVIRVSLIAGAFDAVCSAGTSQATVAGESAVRCTVAGIDHYIFAKGKHSLLVSVAGSAAPEAERPALEAMLASLSFSTQ